MVMFSFKPNYLTCTNCSLVFLRDIRFYVYVGLVHHPHLPIPSMSWKSHLPIKTFMYNNSALYSNHEQCQILQLPKGKFF